MSYNVTILADSLSPTGDRLTTVEATYPRIIHAEVMTHRKFTRNAGSSRAIPNKKLRASVWKNPYVPTYLGKNQAGMQAKEELAGWRRAAAIWVWILASKLAVFVAWLLDWLGVHKQLSNRVLEPFQWYTVIISATEWANFMALRAHPDAQPEIQTLAVLIREAMENSIPVLLEPGEWHLPIVSGRDLEKLKAEGFDTEAIKKISVGRCARVSYYTHLGVRDPNADIDLCDKLVASGHMSPLEHVATPAPYAGNYGNLTGWIQMRKTVPNEDDFSKREAA